MKKNKEPVSTCIQCEGDKMLEVRRHAREAFCIMDMLLLEYGTEKPKGTTIVDYVEKLIEAEKDQRRLVAMIRRDAERRMKEVSSLIAALKFVADTTKETYSGGVNMASKSMTIPLTEIFRVAIHRLESVTMTDKGLLEGMQPQNERNFIAELFAAKSKEATNGKDI